MLFVSYIDFKMIMFRYVLSLLIHFLHSGESSDFLYLLKTKNSDYCLTNSSSAMYFTDNNDKVLEDEEKNPTTFTHPDAFWQVVSSLHNDMLPVFDQRWTNLRTEMITRKDFERAHMLLYPKISKTISNDEKITFSIRANEFEFYLCDSGNIASSFCYWFQMGLEGRVLLRKCDHVISVIEHMRGCECKKPVKTGYLHLSDKNWTHVELEMKKNTFFLKDIDILHEKNILKYRDPRKYKTYYFLIHTEENEAFYKLHEYEYHRTNTSRFIEIKDAWKVNNGKVCFSLFYTTCKHCELKIKLIHIKEKEEKEERKTEEISPTETLPPSFGIWRQEILRMSPYANNTLNYTYILLEANLTHQNVQNPFWAIDSFEKCPESEYHKSTERTELKSCQLVSNGDKVEWTQTGEQEECQCTNNMKKRLGIKDDILKLCERTNGRQRCCQINVNDEKPGSVFDNFKVEWNRNNTIILIWKCRRFNGCSMKNIEILIDYNADHRNTTSIPIEEHTCGEIFHNKIDTIFPWSVQLDIEITAYIDDRKHSINATEYSFPEIPELVNSTITILDEQNDTIRIQINITEKTHQNPNTYKYMFILIADPQESNSDNNFIELKKVLNQNMKQACCFQVIAEIDLSNANQQLFNYTIGDGSVNRSNVLNETIHNNALKRRPSEIIIILTNEYKKKYSSKLYSRLVQKMKVFELTPNSRSDGEEDDKDIYVILFTLLAVCVIGMIIIIFIIYKRKIDRGHSDVQFMTMDEVWQHKLDEDEPNFMDLPSDRKREDAKLPNGLQEARKFPEQSDIIHSKLIEVSEFSEYMKRSLKYRELERQHELFPRGQTQACEYGSLEANKHKNRYETLITYDHSRVVLAKIADDEYSDYINASYIDGYKIANAYIATQGPKKETTRDFWRMIWQENVNFIVMIGNIFGNGKEEIHQYWPKEGETTFGNIVVQIQSVTEFAEFEKRIFYLTHEYETRKLEQIHFTAWPDRGLPLYPHTLLSFVEKMVKIPLASSSPVVVHCSAGIGRTGTILLIDICIRMAVEEESVDFLHTLQKLRQQRPNMVDNAEQYKLAHLVVLDYIHGLRTSIPCDQLDEQLEKLAYNSDELKIQFEFLENCRWIDEAMESVVEIAANYIIPPEKNRFGHIVPERRSVELPIYPGEDSSSFYINAVRVPGIKCPEKYIVTQQPMPNTLGDFWRLIIRMGSEIIISLNEINLDDETCCMFWPTAEDPRIHLEDSIVLRFNERIRFTQYDIYSLEVSDNRVIEMEVKVIALKGWKPQADIPFNGDDFFSFWQDADSLSRNSENIIVTCFDGVTASGVFVALSSVIERMRIEKQCDVGKAVRLVRQNRKQFVRKHSDLLLLYLGALFYNWKYFSENC